MDSSQRAYEDKREECLQLLDEIDRYLNTDEYIYEMGWSNHGTMAHFAYELGQLRDEMYQLGEWAE